MNDRFAIILICFAVFLPSLVRGQSTPPGDAPLIPYKVGTPGRALSLAGPGRRVGAVVFSRDGSRLFVGSADGSIRHYDARIGRQLGPAVETGSGPIHALALGPFGLSLAVAAPDADASRDATAPGDRVTIRLVDGTERKRLSRLPGAVIALAYAADGQTIGAIDHNYNVRIWRVDTGDEVLTSEIHKANGRRPESPETRANFSADLKRAVIVNDADDVPFPEGPANQIVRLWEAGSKEPRILGYRVGLPITSALIESSGSRFITASEVQDVFFYEFPTSRMLFGYGGIPLDRDYRLTFLMLSPDNRRLVKATRRGITDVKKLDEKLNENSLFFGPPGYIRAGAFLPTGVRFASGGWERLGDEKLAGTDQPRYEPLMVWEVKVEGME